ncbi:hypothetical protein OUZ56_008508 [Daphnia magna]|uniref:BPTI/Kunitz inhibitor domain-containing protein n=1 Tax=Daphnia magna TaxID=35525 RepID=A0ABR0AD72_9CRUS|nr:hypothetical protein OUZ56_008508 [Daphnia magna]
MKANSMTGLLVLMAAVLLASSKPTNIGETDIVTEIVRAMEAREEMWRVVSYLKASRDGLLKEFPLFTADGTQQSYTFFAPTSFAFTLQTPQDTVDPLFVDDDLRLRVLIRHFVRSPVSSDDLAKLDKLVMADSNEVVLTYQNSNEVCSLPPVDRTDVACEAYMPMWTFTSATGKCESYVYGGCFGTANLFRKEEDCLSACGPTANTRTRLIKDAEIQPEAIHLPQDIGVVYIVGRVFMDGDEVREAISSHFKRNPNSVLCLGLPCSPGESPTPVDDEAALDIRNTPLAPPPDTPTPVGGFTTVSTNEPDVQEIAEFATKAMSQGANREYPITLVKIVKAEKQVVAGYNYLLVLELKENPVNDAVVVCDVTVFDQSWTSTRQITSFQCDPSLSIAPEIQFELAPLS